MYIMMIVCKIYIIYISFMHLKQTTSDRCLVGEFPILFQFYSLIVTDTL